MQLLKGSKVDMLIIKKIEERQSKFGITIKKNTNSHKNGSIMSRYHRSRERKWREV